MRAHRKACSTAREGGKAIIQDIEEEAGKAGKLPADVFRKESQRDWCRWRP
jgi:hypothetical protein